jgi:hypothetical protein
MAKKKMLKCSKCNRRFSMPAHLARHQKTIHGIGGRGKAAAKRKVRVGRPKGVRAKAARRAGPGAALLGGEVRRILRDLQAHHNALTAQRAALDAQLEGIQQAITAMGAGKAAAPARKRKAVKRRRPVAARRTVKRKTAKRKVAKRKTAKRKAVKRVAAAGRPGSLKDYIVRVLGRASKPMSPREMGMAAIKAGFKTKSKDLTKAVSNTLPKLKGVKKIGFGKYQLGGR